jgi:hypothetical protein
MSRMSDEKIIRFPGGGAGKPGAGAGAGKPRASGAAGAGLSRQEPEPPASLPIDQVDVSTLSPEQQKALGLVLSGLPFVIVAIRPTATGADFFTSLHGEGGDLRNARPHLDEVIGRAYTRKGV